MKQKNVMRLSLDNSHLLDIFFENQYIEIGNVHDHILNRLLNGKIILFDDLVDFEIMKIGIGKSKLMDERMQKYLPFFNFLNVQNKNESLHLFLTYGIYYGQKEDRREFFAPIILIPVQVYNEDGNYYIKLLARPTENTILVNYLKNRGINISKERLDDIYSFDKYLAQLSKTNGKIRLESYITYAKTEELSVVINHDRFSLRNEFEHTLDSRYYLDDDTEICNITPLNNRQRSAVLRAKSGTSFAISGMMGTGKTTTLINIATDAISQNKKVLYLSNKKESIEFVEGEFAKYNLQFLINNLTRGPKSRQNWIKDFRKDSFEEYNEQDVKDNLVKLYSEINDYEKFISGRIRNFRFIEIVSELINLNPDNINFECDDLSELYKFEFEEIVNSLSHVEDAMKKINFKNSLFTSIPINNNVKYPNQVSNLIYQIHRLFVQLKEIKDELQKNYGFIEIENYARLKNYITDILNLDIQKIPKLWKNTKNFEMACKLFPQLKSLVYSLQEYELYIDWDYENVDTIDIDKMIKNLTGEYFTEEDGYKIDMIISSIKTLINKTKAGVQNYRLISKKLGNIKKILNWDFDDDNVYIYKEIVNLANFLDNSIFHKSWLDIENSDNILKELKEITNDLNKHILLSKKYSKYFSNQKNINENIEYLEKLISENRHPKKFKNVDLKELLSDMLLYREIKSKTAALNNRHKELTGFEYSLAYDVTIDFKKFINYINSIETDEVKQIILKFLNNVSDDELEVCVHDLVDFRRSFIIYKEVYESCCDIIHYEKSTVISEQVRVLSNFLKYLNGVSRVCNEMKPILKDKNKKLNLDIFIKLRNQLKQLKRIKKELNNNTNFSLYFGHLYKFGKTNIGEINNIINIFDSYIKCFNSNDAIANSLIPDVHEEISNLIHKSKNIVSQINESFKLYNKIFKDGIGNYYYDSFNNVIRYLDKLNNANEELKAYLDVTESLQVLENHKLYTFVQYIINSNSTSLVENFKYRYFKTLYDIYTKNQNLSTDDMNIILEEVTNYEKKLIQINIEMLKDSRSTFDNDGILTLATSSILNYYLDLSDFDLVLIDDAHLSVSNEFYNAINGKQVIIAGDNTSITGYGTNLMAKMRPKNVMSLNHRYNPTPLNLLNSIPKTQGVYLPNVLDNNGYEIINKDALNLIVDLLFENKNVIINYFVPTIDKKFNFIEKLISELLLNNFTHEDIFNIISKQINIVDLYSGYAYDAMYNIIDIEDYYETKNEFLDLKYLSRLITVQNKLYIIDKQNFISNDNDVLFIHMFKDILSNNNIFDTKIDRVVIKLANRLTELGIKVYGNLYQYSLVLERNNKYHNVLLFVNPSKSYIDLLEDYREYYLVPREKGFNALYIWITDLYENMDKVVDYINKETLS